MTKKEKIQIIIIFMIIVIIPYFILDRQLFYYGESDYTFYNLLPFNIKPENKPDFEKGFTLWDEDEMSLVGKGVRYRQVDSIPPTRARLYRVLSISLLNIFI